jgi:hypothetical protein
MLLPMLGDAAAYLINLAGNPQLAETVKHYDHIPTNISLIVVASALLLSVILSLIFPQERKEKIGDYECEIEQDYDFSDYNNNDTTNQK